MVRQATEHDKNDRLEPRTEVSRELWLLSGNECAFPQCHKRLLNEHDDWQGEIAHIHGVKDTSARYSERMSAEDKRAVENLLLLCPEHHGKVDGQNGRNFYSVRDLQEMKRKHESRFRRALTQVEQEIGDLTVTNVVVPCTTLAGIAPADWTQEDVDYFLPKVNELADIVRGLTQPSRQLLAWRVAQVLPVGIAEVADRMGQSRERIMELVEQLSRFRLAAIEEDEWPYTLVLLTAWRSDGVGPELFADWPEFWDELRSYMADRTGACLEDVIVGLDFSLLDGHCGTQTAAS
ncbi:hypothetical protein ACFV09_41615 [Streptomyces sp. NPDC059631]|uniref:hypothetical protein n=1 Tax=Streptomyces sp. NPDC059631 TaxID=3346890 RepID=UPI0036A19D17